MAQCPQSIAVQRRCTAIRSRLQLRGWSVPGWRRCRKRVCVGDRLTTKCRLVRVCGYSEIVSVSGHWPATCQPGLDCNTRKACVMRRAWDVDPRSVVYVDKLGARPVSVDNCMVWLLLQNNEQGVDADRGEKRHEKKKTSKVPVPRIEYQCRLCRLRTIVCAWWPAENCSPDWRG